MIEMSETIPTEATRFAVIFSAEWCGPCVPAKKALDNVARDKGLNAFVIDVDDNPEQAEKYNVSGLPTVILFEDGEPIDMIAGNITEADLREMM